MTETEAEILLRITTEQRDRYRMGWSELSYAMDQWKPLHLAVLAGDSDEIVLAAAALIRARFR